MINRDILRAAVEMTDLSASRLSSDEKDPGFADWKSLDSKGLRVDVYLDGVEQKNVDTVDCSEGWIRRCKLDADGHIYAEGDEVATEIVMGRVTIAIRECDQ